MHFQYLLRWSKHALHNTRPKRISLVATKFVETILHSWQLGQNQDKKPKEPGAPASLPSFTSPSPPCASYGRSEARTTVSPRTRLCRRIYPLVEPQTAQRDHHHYASPQKTPTDAPTCSFLAGLSPPKPGTDRHPSAGWRWLRSAFLLCTCITALCVRLGNDSIDLCRRPFSVLKLVKGQWRWRADRRF